MTTPVIETLLAAVPSFAAPWASYTAHQVDWAARFPDLAESEPETEFAFLCDLAAHLGERLREPGGLHELSAALSALEPLYLRAGQELADRLTVTFLEGVILSADECGGPLAALDAAAAAAPELVAAEYLCARRYLRGPDDATGTHWVRD